MLKYLWPKNKPIMLMFSIVFGGGLGYTYHRFNYTNTDNSAIQRQVDINNNAIVDSHKQLQHVPNIAQDTKSEKEQQNQVTEQKVETSPSVNENTNAQKSQEDAYQRPQQTQNERRHFVKLADIKEWNFNDKIVEGQLVLIVADLPFNPSFQENIIKQINQICKYNKAVKILRKDLTHEENKKIIENVYKGMVKKETLFLLKNNYQNSLNNIDFDMYMQYPRLLEIYLKTVPLFKDDNISDLNTTISNLNAHQSCLLYLYDGEESAAKQKERLMTAKYIEMELLINNLPAVNLYAVERKTAVKSGLIDESNNRTNSIHLFRKHNIYTPLDPNYYLKPAGGETAVPFHRLTDVGFFAKGSRNLMIPTYLSNIQTFDSSQLGAPFVCTLKVDRNRISSEQYVELLQIFGELKRSNAFPDVCFALRLKQIPYCGENSHKNKQWQITLSNIDELDKQSMMHEIKTQGQLKQSGFNDQNYLRSSHEYLYEHTSLTTSLVREFIQKATKGQLKDYFKSEQKTVLSPIKKLAANQFEQSILNNQSDHLLFQFSDFCPTCKQISPLIGGFADIIQKKGLGLQGLQFYRIDANKNRVKQYMTSPYIPNIYYFKNEWKNNGPVRFPIQFLSHQGPVQLYNFCSITKEIKTMEWSYVEKAINSAKTFKAEQFVI